MKKWFVAGLLLIASTASANTLTLTVHSSPEGATITQSDGAVLGRTPLTLSYPLPRRWKGCATLLSMAALWPSGATAEINPVNACSANGKNQILTFQRSSSAPNAELDFNYSIQLATLHQQAERDAALFMALRPAPAPTPVYIPTFPLYVAPVYTPIPRMVITPAPPVVPFYVPQTIECTTYDYGTITKTRCQ